ncbi:MAG: EAL domain-containing protein [Rhodospirillaceae bacterium]|nr:EAL domain-containing protein [Rhodospirillaceae bacterium]
MSANMAHSISARGAPDLEPTASAVADDDDLEIIDDDLDDAAGTSSGHGPLAAQSRAWTVLIVDDDEDVHAATTFAIRGFQVYGRPIDLVHAYSAAEAMDVLGRQQGIAVALVDVVMEDPDAGLKLVKTIRDAGYLEMRLILRTGQPGYAPELEVISEYDINDYRTKSELTRIRLLSVLTAAIRSYSQIRLINESRIGLEMIVDASANLFTDRNLQLLSRGVLTQVASIMGVPANGLVCIGPRRDDHTPRPDEFTVISDAGRFSQTIGRTLAEVGDPAVIGLFSRTVDSELNLIADGSTAMYFPGQQSRQFFVFLESIQFVSEEIIALLKVFAGNIAISLENVELIERLDSLAFVDPVLGVANYNAFDAALRRLDVETDTPLQVVLVSIDDLDAMIGAFGPSLTQKVKMGVYQLLAEHVPDAHLIAHVGEGTFAILADAGWPLEDIGARALAKPVVVDEIAPTLSATTAVVHVDDESPDAASVLRNGIAALVAARADCSGSVRVYDRTFGEDVRERILLQSALRAALKTPGTIQVALQPKVDATSGSIVGAEALARWSLDGRPVSPAQFIPIAESSGLSGQVTEQVLDRLGQWAAERKAAGLPDLPVAVNLAMHDLHRADFAGWLLHRVKDAGLSPATVEFEITESGVMRHPDRALAELNRLKEAGFEIAIDDFGTGYSSLGYLERLPTDFLKIDRMFVDRLTRANVHRSIAATTVAMAHSLGIKVIAEGVETQEHHEALSLIGCNYRQGYLYGRPVPIESFTDTYADWSLSAITSAA